MLFLKQTKITLLLLLFINASKGQDTINIYLGEPPIDSILKLESNLQQLADSEITTSQFNRTSPDFRLASKIILNNPYYPYTDKFPLDKEITFFRKGSTIPIISSYEFSEKDSTVKVFIYDWEEGRNEKNINKRLQLIKNSKLQKEDFIKKYTEIQAWLIHQYGNPDKASKGEEKVNNEWEYDGKVYKQTYNERFSNWNYEKFVIGLSMLYTESTKRIRLNYYERIAE